MLLKGRGDLVGQLEKGCFDYELYMHMSVRRLVNFELSNLIDSEQLLYCSPPPLVELVFEYYIS